MSNTDDNKKKLRQTFDLLIKTIQNSELDYKNEIIRELQGINWKYIFSKITKQKSKKVIDVLKQLAFTSKCHVFAFCKEIKAKGNSTTDEFHWTVNIKSGTKVIISGFSGYSQCTSRINREFAVMNAFKNFIEYLGEQQILEKRVENCSLYRNQILKIERNLPSLNRLFKKEFENLLRFHGNANLEEAFEKLFTTINLNFVLDSFTSGEETTWICDIADHSKTYGRSQVTHDDDEIGQKLAATGAFLNYSEEKNKQQCVWRPNFIPSGPWISQVGTENEKSCSVSPTDNNDSRRPETVNSNWGAKSKPVKNFPWRSQLPKQSQKTNSLSTSPKQSSSPAGLPPPNLKPEQIRTPSPEFDKVEQKPWWMRSTSQRDSQIIVYYIDANETPPVNSTYSYGQIITRFGNIPRSEIEQIHSAIKKILNGTLPDSIKNKLRKLTFMKRSIGFESIFAETAMLMGKDFEMTTQLTKENPPRTRWTCKITDTNGFTRDSCYVHANCELARQMSLIHMVKDFFGAETLKRKVENQADIGKIKRQKNNDNNLADVSKDSKGTTDILVKKMADSIKLLEDIDENKIGSQKFIPEKKKNFASDKNLFFAKSSLTKPKEIVRNTRIYDKVSPLKKFVEEKEKLRKKAKDVVDEQSIEKPPKAEQKENRLVTEKNFNKTAVKSPNRTAAEAINLFSEESEHQPKSNIFSAFGDYSDTDDEEDETNEDTFTTLSEPVQKIPDFYPSQAVEKDPEKIFKKLTAPKRAKPTPTVEKLTSEKAVPYAKFGDSKDEVYSQKFQTRQEQSIDDLEAKKKMDQLLKMRGGRNKKYLNKVIKDKKSVDGKPTGWNEDITPANTVDKAVELEKTIKFVEITKIDQVTDGLSTTSNIAIDKIEDSTKNIEDSPVKADDDSENIVLHMDIEKSDSFTPVRETGSDTDVERPESFTPIKEIDTAEEEFLGMLDEQSRVKNNDAERSKESQKSETSNFKFSPPPTKEKVECIISTVNKETALVERKLAFKKFHEAFIHLDIAMNKICERIDVIHPENISNLTVKLWKIREETDEKSDFFLWLYETFRKIADTDDPNFEIKDLRTFYKSMISKFLNHGYFDLLSENQSFLFNTEQNPDAIEYPQNPFQNITNECNSQELAEILIILQLGYCYALPKASYVMEKALLAGCELINPSHRLVHFHLSKSFSRQKANRTFTLHSMYHYFKGENLCRGRTELEHYNSLNVNVPGKLDVNIKNDASKMIQADETSFFDMIHNNFSNESKLKIHADIITFFVRLMIKSDFTPQLEHFFSMIEEVDFSENMLAELVAITACLYKDKSSLKFPFKHLFLVLANKLVVQKTQSEGYTLIIGDSMLRNVSEYFEPDAFLDVIPYPGKRVQTIYEVLRSIASKMEKPDGFYYFATGYTDSEKLFLKCRSRHEVKKIVIYVGTNNADQSRELSDLDEVLLQYNLMINEALSNFPNATIYTCLCVKRWDDWQDRLDEFNNKLTTLIKLKFKDNSRVKLIDFRAHFTQQLFFRYGETKNQPGGPNSYVDYVHFSDKGKEFLKKCFDVHLAEKGAELVYSKGFTIFIMQVIRDTLAIKTEVFNQNQVLEYMYQKSYNLLDQNFIAAFSTEELRRDCTDLSECAINPLLSTFPPFTSIIKNCTPTSAIVAEFIEAFYPDSSSALPAVAKYLVFDTNLYVDQLKFRPLLHKPDFIKFIQKLDLKIVFVCKNIESKHSYIGDQHCTLPSTLSDNVFFVETTDFSLNKPNLDPKIIELIIKLTQKNDNAQKMLDRHSNISKKNVFFIHRKLSDQQKNFQDKPQLITFISFTIFEKIMDQFLNPRPKNLKQTSENASMKTKRGSVETLKRKISDEKQETRKIRQLRRKIEAEKLPEDSVKRTVEKVHRKSEDQRVEIKKEYDVKVMAQKRSDVYNKPVVKKESGQEKYRSNRERVTRNDRKNTIRLDDYDPNRSRSSYGNRIKKENSKPNFFSTKQRSDQLRSKNR